MAETTDSKRAAAYVTWGTFRNALNNLAKSGMPNRIDRSVFIGLSGGTQNQLVAAMKFLRLTGDQGEPSDRLRELVAVDEIARKEPLQRVFRDVYARLFDLDLTKATPRQINEVMSEHYGVSGSTQVKAVRFFLAGVQDLDIAVSPLLKRASGMKVRTGNGTPRRRKRKASTGKPSSAASAASAAGTSRTVSLKSGGELTLSATIDPFALSESDRSFVFKLVDQLNAYDTAAFFAMPQHEADAADESPRDVAGDPEVDDGLEEGAQ